ncbi:hypothetical protein HYW21_09015 [Candidatus Woesearchaeota archaeon]|nr:hypothetical protein [Candidatus Woesearchaeota archaeon]
MAEKAIIMYDLKGKSNSERTQIIRKLYGYRDKSNYDYNYEREGLLRKIDLNKSRKTVLHVKNKGDITKVVTILKELKIEFELAKF